MYSRLGCGAAKRLRPTRIRENKMKLKVLVVSLLLALSPSLTAQNMLTGTQPPSENKKIGQDYSAKGDWAVFLMFPLAVNFSNYSMRYGGSLGKYVSDHSSLMTGFMYNNGKSDFKTIGASGYATTKTMKVNSIIIPFTYSYSIFGHTKGFDIKLQAGFSFNYVTSMKLDSDNYDLGNVDRSGFSGHVRVVLSYLAGLFVEYDFPFEDGDGMMMYGFCFDW